MTVPTKKKSGRPRQPTKSLKSILANVHLLLRVPSFARWPLKLHFFRPDVYAAWQKWCSTTDEPLRASLAVVTDFGEVGTGEKPKGDPPTTAGAVENAQPDPDPWGIHALPLDYEPIKPYVAKGQEIFEFERQGCCVVCLEPMAAGEGLHAICTNAGCEGVGHLSCWGQHLLSLDGQATGDMLPIQGRCPKCDGDVQWVDMMKELTLRIRGQREVEKLLKAKRRRGAKAAKAQVTIDTTSKSS